MKRLSISRSGARESLHESDALTASGAGVNVQKPRTSRSRLYLLTQRYPYGTGEEFLDPEIELLSKAFELVILPGRPARALTGHLPAGVDVVTPPSVGGSLFAIVRNVRFLDLLRDLFQGVRNSEPSTAVPGAVANTVLRYLEAARRTIHIKQAEELRGGPDVIYSYWGNAGALALALHRDAPRFVSRLHGYDLYPEQAVGGHLPGRDRIIDAATAVLVPSQAALDYLSAAYPIAASKFRLARLGVPKQSVPNPISTDGKIRILSIAHAVKVKRLHLILAGLAEARSLGLDVEWTHVGDGPSLSRIRRDAERLGLEGVVRLVGHLPRGEHGLYPFLRRDPFDLALNTSSSEGGSPVALQEALSFGIPIMATDVGGNTEIVALSNGVLLPSTPSGADLASALHRYAMLPESARCDWRRHCVSAQQTHFESSTNGQRLVDLLMG